VRLEQLTLRSEASAENALRKEDKEFFIKVGGIVMAPIFTNNVGAP
jgi:hypothetical protein